MQVFVGFCKHILGKQSCSEARTDLASVAIDSSQAWRDLGGVALLSDSQALFILRLQPCLGIHSAMSLRSVMLCLPAYGAAAWKDANRIPATEPVAHTTP